MLGRVGLRGRCPSLGRRRPAGARGEHRIGDGHHVVRTPNTFSFDVEARAPSTILLNGTYDKGWRSNVGTTAERAKQLILEVPAGTHHVVVRYRPRTFGVAVALTVVGLAGAIGALALDARRRRGIRSSARTAGEIL